MLRPVSSPLCFVGLVVLLASSPPALAQESKTFDRTFEFPSGGRLALDTFKGSIVLRPGDSDRLQLRARILPPDNVDRDYGRRAVEKTEVDVDVGDQAISIESDYDDVPCREHWLVFGCATTLPYIHYEITAPREVEIEIDDYKSRIELSGFYGRFTLDTHKGRVLARDLEGDLRLETHKGEAELTNLRGTVRLDTHKGVIEADEIDAEVEIDTHKGHIELTGLRGSVEVKTHRGEIALKASHLRDDSRLETYRGVIELSLEEDQGLTLDAWLGDDADFSSDFPLAVSAKEGERLRGTINGGGPRLYLKSEKGEVRIRRPL